MDRAVPAMTRALAFACGLAAAAIPALVYSGFTVDDALIPARYAHNIALGHGYAFNAGGPVTDGVTPLGFPYLIAPFASAGPLRALAAARVLGALAWLAAAGLLGLEVQRIGGKRTRYAALLLVLCSAPLGAWCQAGLETGIVTALVAASLFARGRGHTWTSTIVVGAAAAMRPELLPMAAVLAFPRAANQGRTTDDRSITPAHFGRLFVAALPFAIVASIRLARFGQLAPLSFYAKPPDLGLGTNYALACFALTGPVALLAPFTIAKLDPYGKWLIFAVLVHYVAVAVAGGDWMPLSRLVVPVMPVVVLAAARVAAIADGWFTFGRFILALTAESLTFVRMHESSVRVLEERTALIHEVSPWLQGRNAVATLDVGWVGAATESTVVDLAGVTDPFIAFLPGSHTTKRIPDSLIDARHVDTLVLLLHSGTDVGDSWAHARFDRGVERYVALGPGIEDEFSVAYVSTGRLHYVVLYRVEST